MDCKTEMQAIAMANDFAGAATLDRVFWQLLFEGAGREPLSDLCALFDPEFRKKSDLETTMQVEIANALPKDKQELFAEFVDVKLDNLMTWQTASFYIGAAWGKQIASIGDGSPVVGSQPTPASAPPTEKGLAVALDLVGNVSLMDTFRMAGDRVDDRHLVEIPMAIDEQEYRDDKAKFDRAKKLFEESLTPSQKMLYSDLDDAHDALKCWVEASGFYLGYAMAIRSGAGFPAAAVPLTSAPTAPAASAAAAPTGKSKDFTETKAEQKPSLDDAITNILDDVDNRFYAALQPGCTVGLSHAPWAYMRSQEYQKLYDQLEKMLMKGKEPEMEDEDDVLAILWAWASYQENSSVATSYCAGLRAAGLSEETTRQLMRGFLRRFEDPHAAT